MKLPFVGRIFWPILLIVVALVLAGWYLIPRWTSYEMQSQDYPGSAICGVILAYLVHLWLLPPEGPPRKDEDDSASE